jgi:hypothetical protein
MNNKLNNIKSFILNFDFENPCWEKLPIGFPHLSKQGLTIEEGHLLDAIYLAWVNTEGRGHFYKRSVKLLLIVIATVFIISYGGNLLKANGGEYAKRVNAATISATFKSGSIKAAQDAGDVFESTVSAIFRQK